MDGLKGRLKDSLRFRLSFWLVVSILGVATAAAALAFSSAIDEANEMQDDVLRQVATLFERHHLSVPAHGDAVGPFRSDENLRVVVQLLSTRETGARGSLASVPVRLPPTLADGMQSVAVGRDTYRVFVKTLDTGERMAVAQDTEVRDAIARDTAVRTLMPFVILMTVIPLVVTHLVRRMFRPIARLSADVDRRGEHDLHPIATQLLPAEVRPFVVAINRLLGRVAQAMESQRRFIAGAAHELRSPLTALSLQAERLATADLPEGARERLHTLRGGIERSRNLLEQLLSLARAQSFGSVPADKVSVQKVFRRVLEDLMPLAEEKGIDIGVVGAAEVWVQAGEVDLVTIVRNLVDNAIRYTPPGGRVDLTASVIPDGVRIDVEDNGEGIAPAERGRVFEPFYRVLGSEQTGSGLGLSIVKAIAERLGGRVALSEPERSGTGLRVSVFLPAEPKGNARREMPAAVSDGDAGTGRISP